MTKNPVSYLHIRHFKNGAVDSRGGVTVAFRETTPGVIDYAEARCSPVDNFNKAYGRTKAAGRLNSERFSRVAYGRDLITFRHDVMTGVFTL